MPHVKLIRSLVARNGPMPQAIAKSPLGSIPKEMAALLGEPVLVRGENSEDFYSLLLSIANATGAINIIGWSWCNDVAYHIWEGRRFLRIRSGILVEAQVEVVEELLKSTYDGEEIVAANLYKIIDAKNEAHKWASNPEFGEKIDKQLHLRGYDRNSVLAKAYLRCNAPLAQIDRSISDLENRRTATLREIARHDAAMARRFEDLSKVIDGEFSEAAE